MSEDVFVLVFAARYHKASARFVFRGFTKKCLNDNLIKTIHERYMVLVHLDESARSTIRAALERYWWYGAEFLEEIWFPDTRREFPEDI